MANISLTAGVRSNLLSLQGTANLLNQTQSRLGSGKKVSSPIDNPSAYFTAQALTNRASDLTARLDGISKGINTVKAATAGITGITALLDQAKGIANDARALSSTDAAGRSALGTQYDEVLKQITSLAKDSGYDGVNLLQGDNLSVNFGEKLNQSTLSLTGFNAAAPATAVQGKAGLGLATAASHNAFAANTDVDAAITEIETASTSLRTSSKTLAANLSVLTSRQDFTKSMVDTLTTGSDTLTNADLNTEAANLLALNTQQQLGINALSLASQASQSVLKLLG